jgi:hypothetical protein
MYSLDPQEQTLLSAELQHKSTYRLSLQTKRSAYLKASHVVIVTGYIISI